MKYLFAALALAVVLAVGWMLLGPVSNPQVPVIGIAPQQPALPPLADGPPRIPAGEMEPEMPPELASIPLDPDAIASLRGARVFGDPRTPPIERSPPREQATAEELADPEKYAEFEGRAERKLKRSYVIESEKYVAQLRDDVERGKAIGIPPDEIAKVEQKIRGIEEMRARLLAEDPQLLDASSPAPPKPEVVDMNPPRPVITVTPDDGN